MKTLILLICLIVTGCSSFGEMSETGNPPVGVTNQISGLAKFVEESLCPLKTARNIERVGVRLIRVIVPDWEQICEEIDKGE